MRGKVARMAKLSAAILPRARRDAEAEAAGRRSLAEIRRTVALLRVADDGVSPVPDAGDGNRPGVVLRG